MPTSTDSFQRALAGLALIAAGSALAPAAGLWLRRVWPERTMFFARWGFFPVLLAASMAGLATWLAARALPDHPTSSLLLPVVGFAVALAWSLRVTARLHPESWRALGLRAAGSLRAAAAGAGTYALLAPLVLGAGLAWPWMLERMGATRAAPAHWLALTGAGGVELAGAIALAVALGPALEELFFRGFVQPLFVQNLGEPGGIAACSLAFALMHGPSAAPGAFVLSLAAGFAMLRTQRISAPIAVHALHNAVVIAIVLCVPGGRDLV